MSDAIIVMVFVFVSSMVVTWGVLMEHEQTRGLLNEVKALLEDKESTI